MTSIAIPLTVPSDKEIVGPLPFRLGYRPWLDGLRGIAILAVIAFHASPQLLSRGHLGVDLFFVLSGFLITCRLLEEFTHAGQIRLHRFYLRRALRLMPGLIVMATVVGLVMWLKPDFVSRHYLSLLYAVGYITNWTMVLSFDHISPVLYHTWSLAIEEQFYLLWPIVIQRLLRARVSPRALLWILSLLVVLVASHRYALLIAGASEARLSLASDTRIDGLLIGCCLGISTVCGLLPKNINALQSATLALALACLMYLFGWGARFGLVLTLVNLFFASLILLMLVRPPQLVLRFLSASALVWAGKLSYSLYLWHILAKVVAEQLTTNPASRLLMYLVLAFGVATCSYYLIEERFLRLKSRLSISSEPVQ